MPATLSIPPHMTPLSRDFYARDTLVVAENLLGCHVVRELESGLHLMARIVEVEAYMGPHDSACHAAKGRTARTEVMFGPPGHAYVYLIYGMHHMLNFITLRDGYPCGVLLRAVEPVLGEPQMRLLRSAKGKQLSNGPGKLTRALGVDKSLYGHDLTLGTQLWASPRSAGFKPQIAYGPRVGIGYAESEHREAPWRLWLKGNEWVSKAR
ncbi:DNA-3-methyladenine glycosylase [Vreelandella zhuhanensis]|nr:DNA-3-methyladenine glycosylase [Halomonas zhuhanensis]